jgi:hypothetical protein
MIAAISDLGQFAWLAWRRGGPGCKSRFFGVIRLAVVPAGLPVLAFALANTGRAVEAKMKQIVAGD